MMQVCTYTSVAQNTAGIRPRTALAQSRRLRCEDITISEEGDWDSCLHVVMARERFLAQDAYLG